MNGNIKLNQCLRNLRQAILLLSWLAFAGVNADDKVDMQAMDMPVQQIFVRLAAAAEVNLVMQGNLDFPVHVLWQQLSAIEALQLLCRVAEVHCYWQAAGALLVTAQAIDPVHELQIVTVPVHFAEAEQVAQQLHKHMELLAGGQLLVDKRSQNILLRVPKNQVQPLLQLITGLDQPLQQLHIEARIVIASSDVGASLRQGLGLQLSSRNSTRNNATELAMLGADGLAALQMGVVASHILLNLELAAMEASGQVLTLAQPQVVVQEGQLGVIETGQEVPYVMEQDGNQSRQWKQAVLGLSVTPRVLPNDEVELDLLVVQDSVGELLENGELALNTHRLHTRVKLGLGQTLVLGGALYEQQLQRLLNNPAWMSLPFFGKWMQDKKRESQRFELLVFVTPRQVN
jgi:type II secretory pathway component HofQ